MARSDELGEPSLQVFLERARIDCEHLFKYACPRYWSELEKTDDRLVRSCHECERDVRLVTSEAEFNERAKRGECIAVIVAQEIPGPETVSPDSPTLPGVEVLMGDFSELDSEYE